MRFILPNHRMASDVSLGGVAGRLFVRPASHAGAPSGPKDSVPYGARLRLRADFPLTGYPASAKVILNTFKRYGIVLADGGNVALTAESDRYTATQWADLGIDSRLFDLTPGATDLAISDFEVIDTGPRIAETYECVRSTIMANQPRIGVMRSGQWFLDRNGNAAWDGCGEDACFVFGGPGDQALAGDWNGDGVTEIGARRGSQWFLDNGNGQWDGCGAFPAQDRCVTFGSSSDQGVVGDWNGDGMTDIAVKRGSQWFLDNGDGAWNGCGSFPNQDLCISFGLPTDQPVASDWSGDGFSRVGIYRNGQWLLDANGNDQFDNCQLDRCWAFGLAGDQPVTADWNGNGVTGIGVKRSSAWFLDRDGDGAWSGCGTDGCISVWGAPTDQPVTGYWKEHFGH
ncbi:MAG: VCBS repeat-containing protein [Candidatus Competibacteraceae bacterium]